MTLIGSHTRQLQEDEPAIVDMLVRNVWPPVCVGATACGGGPERHTRVDLAMHVSPLGCTWLQEAIIGWQAAARCFLWEAMDV